MLVQVVLADEFGAVSITRVDLRRWSGIYGNLTPKRLDDEIADIFYLFNTMYKPLLRLS